MTTLIVMINILLILMLTLILLLMILIIIILIVVIFKLWIQGWILDGFLKLLLLDDLA